MNINISSIKKLSVSSKVINNYIQGILINFQRHIISASKNGLNNVSIPVPANFTVAGMSNKNAQTIIYNKLIKEVEKNGFKVSLKMQNNSVIYNITWVFDEDDSNLKEMRSNIASHVED